jgi:serine/threonine protein phosphatase PrpC
VQAAADMLAAAADFLTGPQLAGSSSKEHRPMRGEEALNLSFSGGSTAEGHEVHHYSAYGSRKFQEADASHQQQHSKPDKMTIRGEDGRIIKDRLRSVQVGEDSYFLRPDSLGVADGVGGWSSRPGADPALFSRLLMHFCAVELSRYDNVSAANLAADNGNLLNAWAAVDPVEVMHRAWERCVRAARREGILGSSTALLALLRGDELRIANVGDCVLMIIRDGEMLFRSTEQQHSFNFPVQLGMMGDTSETLKNRTEAANKARAAGEGEVKSEHLEDYDDVEDMPATSREASATSTTFEELIVGANSGQADGEDGVGAEWDEPRRDAGRWSVRVEAGDIIVVGSDGLMDNLFDEDIVEEVLRFVPMKSDASQGGGEQQQFLKVDSSTFSPQLVSEALCSRAKAISEDSRAISSPFQQRAMEEGLHYVGGKHDDISVLVCLVGEREGLDTSGEASDPTRTTTSGKCFIH